MPEASLLTTCKPMTKPSESTALVIYEPRREPLVVETLSSRDLFAVIGLSSSISYTLNITAATPDKRIRSISRDAASLRDTLRTILPPATFAALGKLISQEVSRQIWEDRPQKSNRKESDSSDGPDIQQQVRDIFNRRPSK